MPLFRLIGDSSLYTKSGKNVKRIGPQLQEQLGTTDLWYCAVANAGVREILQMLKESQLTFETLGISFSEMISQKGGSASRCAVLFIMRT